MLIHIAIGALIAQCAHGTSGMFYKGIKVTLGVDFAYNKQVDRQSRVYSDGTTLHLIGQNRSIRGTFKELGWKPEYLMSDGDVSKIGDTNGNAEKLSTFFHMVNALAKEDLDMFKEWAFVDRNLWYDVGEDSEDVEREVELIDITDVATFTLAINAFAAWSTKHFVQWAYEHLDDDTTRLPRSRYAKIIKGLAAVDEDFITGVSQQCTGVIERVRDDSNQYMFTEMIKVLAAKDAEKFIEWAKGFSRRTKRLKRLNLLKNMCESSTNERIAALHPEICSSIKRKAYFKRMKGDYYKASRRYK